MQDARSPKMLCSWKKYIVPCHREIEEHDGGVLAITTLFTFKASNRVIGNLFENFVTIEALTSRQHQATLSYVSLAVNQGSFRIATYQRYESLS